MLEEEPSAHPAVILPKEIALPQGTADDLHRRSLDASLSLRERVKAAYAEGRIHAQSGDRGSALETYKKAFAMIRSVFPFYPGTDPDASLIRGPRS